MSMWGKRREDELLPAKPAAVPPRPLAPAAPNLVETKKETAPLSSMSNPPHRNPEPDRSQASIGKAVKIVGQISSREDLYVDGDVEGTIEALEHKLTVGPNGKVHAGIKAREVVILGNVQGNVDAADKLEIKKDARVIGDVKTARISIEDGAFLKGSIESVKPEAPKMPKQPAQPSHPAAAATSPAGASAGQTK